MENNESNLGTDTGLIEKFKTGLKIKFSWQNSFETKFMTKIPKGYEIHEEKY